MSRAPPEYMQLGVSVWEVNWRAGTLGDTGHKYLTHWTQEKEAGEQSLGTLSS